MSGVLNIDPIASLIYDQSFFSVQCWFVSDGLEDGTVASKIFVFSVLYPYS